MRRPEELVHTRTRVTERYALMPLEGFPVSRLPSHPEVEARVLASAALGARFVEMILDVPRGKVTRWGGVEGEEHFYFVLAGKGRVREGSLDCRLEPGSFGLLPPGVEYEMAAEEGLRILSLRKRYEAARGVPMFKSLHGHESRVEKKVWAENSHSLLQTLIPDEMAFDLAMNIFSFDPGCGLPIVETHVMEHGLLFLEGKGLYYLGNSWIEVEKDDFIWMGPYCPQSFCATGPVASRYIYYKNVNREISA